jgi:hypothetical protein
VFGPAGTDEVGGEATGVVGTSGVVVGVTGGIAGGAVGTVVGGVVVGGVVVGGVVVGGVDVGGVDVGGVDGCVTLSRTVDDAIRQRPRCAMQYRNESGIAAAGVASVLNAGDAAGV